jgi:hypothetical protein
MTENVRQEQRPGSFEPERLEQILRDLP